MRKVGHQILDHVHVRQRSDLDVALMSSIGVVQASPLRPSMFIEQDPQMPSRQERRKVKVGVDLILDVDQRVEDHRPHLSRSIV